MSNLEETKDDEGLVSFIVNIDEGLESQMEQERKTILGTSYDDGNDKYYIPKIKPSFLFRLMRTNPHHSGLPRWKARQIVKFMLPNAVIPRKELEKVLMEYEACGNGYAQKIKNKAGQVIELRYLPALNMRKMRNETNRYGWLKKDGELTPFKTDEVIHLQQHDPLDSQYGVPYWVGAVVSILLGEDVRLFPRRFFNNNATADKLIALAGATATEEEAFQRRLSETRRKGQFKTIVLGTKGNTDIDKQIKVINFGEHSAKIDYSKLAEMTATDILEAWQIRPELVGMMPGAVGGTGDIKSLQQIYYENEIEPMLEDLEEAFSVHRLKDRLRFKRRQVESND